MKKITKIRKRTLSSVGDIAQVKRESSLTAERKNKNFSQSRDKNRYSFVVDWQLSDDLH